VPVAEAAQLNGSDLSLHGPRSYITAAPRDPITYVAAVPSDVATVKLGSLRKPADQRQGRNEPDVSPRQPCDVVVRQ